MGTINITNRFNNPDKRYAEAVVMSVPAVINEGGGRTQADPVYTQFGDDMVANVIERDSVLKKVYLVVDEAFAATATVTVDIDGTAVFTDADAATEGLTASATEDLLVEAGAAITVTLGTLTGDATVGSLRVVADAVSMSVKNGNYSVTAV